MYTQHITARTVASLPPSLIIQALDRLADEDKALIAARMCEIIRRTNAWTKPLVHSLLGALQEEMDEQADEARWMDREELRGEFQLGHY